MASERLFLIDASLRGRIIVQRLPHHALKGEYGYYTSVQGCLYELQQQSDPYRFFMAGSRVISSASLYSLVLLHPFFLLLPRLEVCAQSGFMSLEDILYDGTFRYDVGSIDLSSICDSTNGCYFRLNDDKLLAFLEERVVKAIKFLEARPASLLHMGGLPPDAECRVGAIHQSAFQLMAPLVSGQWFSRLEAYLRRDCGAVMLPAKVGTAVNPFDAAHMLAAAGPFQKMKTAPKAKVRKQGKQHKVVEGQGSLLNFFKSS